jgi:hypothetical protein
MSFFYGCQDPISDLFLDRRFGGRPAQPAGSYGDRTGSSVFRPYGTIRAIVSLDERCVGAGLWFERRRPDGEISVMLIGKCPGCGRTARLGKLVGERYVVGADGSRRKETIPTDERLRCIDCCFGPAMCHWKRCPKCGALTPNLAGCEVCRAAEGAHRKVRRLRMHRRVEILIRRIDVWLQGQCLRSDTENTHAWCAKMERLNSHKVTSRQIVRSTADVRSFGKRT